MPPKGYTAPCLQLFVMDEDGANVDAIAPMNIGSALHPTHPAGRAADVQQLRKPGAARPAHVGHLGDLARWPRLGAGRQRVPFAGQAFHFMTQLGNGDLVVDDYYNLNNNGFGALYRLPLNPPAGQPPFHSAFAANAPAHRANGRRRLTFMPLRMPFQPRGIYSITPFTTGQDEAAPVGSNGVRVGKFTHPSAAPDNDLLVVWTPGPANDLNRPTHAAVLRRRTLCHAAAGTLSRARRQLVLIKNDPAYNEAWPRAVVPYRAVHGMDEPARLPWLPNDGTAHPRLPRGHGLRTCRHEQFLQARELSRSRASWSNISTGSMLSTPTRTGRAANWEYQGADAGKYSNSDIFAVRILAMEPNTHRSYGPNWKAMQVLSITPTSGCAFSAKFRCASSTPTAPMLDPEGNPDTSFWRRFPPTRRSRFRCSTATGWC